MKVKSKLSLGILFFSAMLLTAYLIITPEIPKRLTNEEAEAMYEISHEAVDTNNEELCLTLPKKVIIEGHPAKGESRSEPRQSCLFRLAEENLNAEACEELAKLTNQVPYCHVLITGDPENEYCNQKEDPATRQGCLAESLKDINYCWDEQLTSKEQGLCIELFVQSGVLEGYTDENTCKEITNETIGEKWKDYRTDCLWRVAVIYNLTKESMFNVCTLMREVDTDEREEYENLCAPRL